MEKQKSENREKTPRILVVGGGAAGMMAALFAVGAGHSVHLFEQNEKLGKKLFITGKGRCNFTNACSREDILRNVISNPRFLYSSIHAWDSDDSIRFFEELGVPVKVERGNRAFPASDHSSDIIRALEKALRDRGVVIHLRSKVTEICIEEITAENTAENEQEPHKQDLHDQKSPGQEIHTCGITYTAGRRKTSSERKKKDTKPAGRVVGVRLENGTVIRGEAVILAAGGLSYPSTGATGDGLRFAADAGHSVTACRPALVPLETREPWAAELQGLSLRNVTLTIPYGKKKKYEEFGEMLFTHFGISGPLVLSASSVIGEALEKGPLEAWINLKPALDDAQLDARLLRELEQSPNRSFRNAVSSLFPARLLPVMIRLSGIPQDRPAREITHAERQRFLQLIRHLPMTVTGTRSFREAIITQGGVSVREIDPATMESRKIRGLYLCGEMLDLDALTGGFNLQIAWATGHAAGCAAGAALSIPAVI